MKYLKWISIAIGITVITAILSVLKYSKDWEKDFAPYSSRIIYEEINYVPQPVSNMINEEQRPIGQTETTTHRYYITTVINSRDTYRVYSYDKQGRETKLEYEVTDTHESGMLVGVSSNGRKMILDYTTKIVLVDLLTQMTREIYTGQRECTAVYGQDILYQDETGYIHRYNIRTGEDVCIDGIVTSLFVVYEDSIYYIDENNGECLSIYDMNTGETKRTEQKLSIGFFMGEEGIYVR